MGTGKTRQQRSLGEEAGSGDREKPSRIHKKSLGFPPGSQRIGAIESSGVLDAIAEFAAEAKSNTRSQNRQGTRSLEQGQLEGLRTISNRSHRGGDVS